MDAPARFDGCAGAEEHPLRPVGRPVLSAQDVVRILDRIAHQVLEKTDGAADLVLLGIPTRGTFLAARLASRLEAFAGHPVSVGSLDITLYRDDLARHATRPLAATVEPVGGIDGRLVLLVDDVLFSGRTVRAALDALTDLGRPRAVQLAVLVDRGHRELPIRADYVGKNLPTARAEQVRVQIQEFDGTDGVLLLGAGFGAESGTESGAASGGAESGASDWVRGQ